MQHTMTKQVASALTSSLMRETKNHNVRKALEMFFMWIGWGESYALATEAAGDFLETVADVDEFARVLAIAGRA